MKKSKHNQNWRAALAEPISKWARCHSCGHLNKTNDVIGKGCRKCGAPLSWTKAE